MTVTDDNGNYWSTTDYILNSSYAEGMGTFTTPTTGVNFVGWYGYSDYTETIKLIKIQ